MNIYGDTGNIIALEKRARWRGINIKLKVKSLKSKIKTGECDLYFFGGGQDQAQEIVARDLAISDKGKVIKEEVERGVPLLSVCGGYQLLGEYYQPHEGPKLPGVGLFPTYTVASDKRMIGNIVIQTTNYPLRPLSLLRKASEASQLPASPTQPASQGERGEPTTNLVGFENHSGKTFLKECAQPLGKVIKGFGNNGEDGNEGCIYKNAIGCYMHGSLLPKNPELADWLLQKALEVKYGKEIKLEPLDDTLENQAHNFALSRFR